MYEVGKAATDPSGCQEAHCPAGARRFVNMDQCTLNVVESHCRRSQCSGRAAARRSSTDLDCPVSGEVPRTAVAWLWQGPPPHPTHESQGSLRSVSVGTASLGYAATPPRLGHWLGLILHLPPLLNSPPLFGGRLEFQVCWPVGRSGGRRADDRKRCSETTR